MKGLNVSCPECGAHFSLLHAMEDADGRRFIGLLSDAQPVVVRPLIRYLALFKPARQGMRWSRMYSLAMELVPMIKAAEVKHNGNTYTVPPQKWADTMLALVETPPKSLRLPLKSHGYLISILAGDAESVAAKAEQKDIEQKRNRGQIGLNKGPAQISTVVPVASKETAAAALKAAQQALKGNRQQEPTNERAGTQDHQTGNEEEAQATQGAGELRDDE